MISTLEMLAKFKDWVPYPWIQIPGLFVAVGLLIFWWKKRQKEV